MKLYVSNPSYISWKIKEAIEEVEAERVTENSYWANGRKHSKKTNYYQVFDTREEAKQHLINRFKERVQRFEQQLAEEKENLKKAENL